MRRKTDKGRLIELAAKHFGVVSRQMARSLGLSDSQVDRMLRSKELVSLYPAIYLVGGSPTTWQARGFGATLWGGPGTALSHRAAAALWKFTGMKQEQVEITTTKASRLPNVVCHRGNLEQNQVVVIDGISVTSVHRTLIDLGDVASRTQVEDAVDCALRRGVISEAWLMRELNRRGTKGRKGAAMLAHILGSNEMEAPPSWLERRFLRLLTQVLPPAVREHPVMGGKYRIDFAWPVALFGVEVHGARWHLGRRRWTRDLNRHNELTAAGWTILHFNWDQIRSNPEKVIAEIRATYERLMGLCLSI